MGRITVRRYYLRGVGSGFRAYEDDVPLSRKPISIDLAMSQAKALDNAGKMKGVLNYPLSDQDLHELIPTLKVRSYEDIADAKTIDSILDSKGRLIILYQIEEHSGHWICLRKKGDIITYFDSLGYSPDGERSFVSKTNQRDFGMINEPLKKLLQECPYKIIVNKTKFQKDSADVSTCGKWCIFFLFMKHLTLQQFTTLVKSTDLNPDKLVSGFIYGLLKK